MRIEALKEDEEKLVHIWAFLQMLIIRGAGLGNAFE